MGERDYQPQLGREGYSAPLEEAKKIEKQIAKVKAALELNKLFIQSLPKDIKEIDRRIAAGEPAEPLLKGKEDLIQGNALREKQNMQLEQRLTSLRKAVTKLQADDLVLQRALLEHPAEFDE
jgi:hypothetical protein